MCQSTDPTDYSLTKGTSKKERTRLASSRCLLVTGSSLPSLCTPLSLIPPHLTLTRYPLFSRLFSFSIFFFFSISLYKNGYLSGLYLFNSFSASRFFFYNFPRSRHCHVVQKRREQIELSMSIRICRMETIHYVFLFLLVLSRDDAMLYSKWKMIVF